MREGTARKLQYLIVLLWRRPFVLPSEFHVLLALVPLSIGGSVDLLDRAITAVGFLTRSERKADLQANPLSTTARFVALPHPGSGGIGTPELQIAQLESD